MPQDDLIGSVIGDYRIDRLLGEGGIGAVYLAHHEILEQPYALKVLLPAFAINETFQQRFFREAKRAAAIRHPNVVQVLNAGRDGSTLFLVMEYVEGATLKAFAREGGGRVEPELVARMAVQALSGLQAAHKLGIIHRDIKPDNLMLDAAGNVKITDFGLARADEDAAEALTLSGQVMGTPAYMPPEQWDGIETDARSDIYALGASMFALLAGQPPFVGKTTMAIAKKVASDPVPSVRAFVPEVDPVFDLILRKMLAKDPDKRLPSAEACLTMFSKWRAGKLVVKLRGLSASASGQHASPDMSDAVEMTPPSAMEVGRAQVVADQDGFVPPDGPSDAVMARSGAASGMIDLSPEQIEVVDDLGRTPFGRTARRRTLYSAPPRAPTPPRPSARDARTGTTPPARPGDATRSGAPPGTPPPSRRSPRRDGASGRAGTAEAARRTSARMPAAAASGSGASSSHAPDVVRRGREVALSKPSAPAVELAGTRLGAFQLNEPIEFIVPTHVFQARDLARRQPCVVKVIPIGPDEAGKTYAPWVARAADLKRINHPNIAPIRYLAEQAHYAYLATGLVEGTSMQDRIAENGPPALDEGIRWLLQVGAALEYIHSERLLHGNLKPSNVVIEPSGLVKLVELGLPRRMIVAGRPMIGSPLYMAPEQWFGAAPSVAGEIHAFGVLTFQVLAGRPPFAGRTPVDVLRARTSATVPSLSSIGISVPPALEHLIGLMTHPTRTKRPASMKLVVRHLQRIN